ncbi:MAG: CPBP family intramembrane glutamic endopeptidase [Candidatus Hodarchaeales archaeon]|jgi:membrane protease YdiL (CAAX protease family)
MEIEEIIGIIVITLIQLGPLLFLVWLIHKKVGEYPDPLPLSKHPRREIRDVFLFYIIALIFYVIITAVIFSVFSSQITTDRYAIEPAIFLTLTLTLPLLIIPFVYVRRVNSWNIEDMGLTTKVQNINVIVVAIIGTLILNIVALMFGKPLPVPLLFLLLAMYFNIFLEEFFYRGVIQSKLERILGQNKAWFYGGILFGLVHIFSDYFIPFLNGEEIHSVLVSGTGELIFQIVNGWFLGILYMKTRNLIPGIIVHFIANYSKSIFVWFI